MPAAYPKVLFLPRWYPDRNDPQIGVFIQKHAKAVSSFCDVKVLYAAPAEDLPTKFEVERTGADVDEVRVYYRKSKGLFNAWRYFQALNKGLKLLKKEGWQPDLLHVHVMLRTAVFAWLKGWPVGKPFLISEHASGYLNGKIAARGGFYKALMMKCFWQAKAITAVSPHLAEGMKSFGVPGEVRVVPNIVAFPELAIAATGGRVQILTIADLVDDIKNISGIIEAVGQLLAEGADVEFHIVGGGPDEERLKALAAKCTLPERIVFYGRLDNEAAMEKLATADFVVINSRVETFALVVAEAIAAGKPVVATRCGGPEQFISSDTGILVDVDKPEQLKAAIKEMATGLEKYDPITMRNTLGDRYSSTTVGGQFHELYLDIMRRN